MVEAIFAERSGCWRQLNFQSLSVLIARTNPRHSSVKYRCYDRPMLTRRASIFLIVAALAALAQKGPEKQNPKAAGAATTWTPPPPPRGDSDVQGACDTPPIPEVV